MLYEKLMKNIVLCTKPISCSTDYRSKEPWPITLQYTNSSVYHGSCHARVHSLLLVPRVQRYVVGCMRRWRRNRSLLNYTYISAVLCILPSLNSTVGTRAYLLSYTYLIRRTVRVRYWPVWFFATPRRKPLPLLDKNLSFCSKLVWRSTIVMKFLTTLLLLLQVLLICRAAPLQRPAGILSADDVLRSSSQNPSRSLVFSGAVRDNSETSFKLPKKAPGHAGPLKRRCCWENNRWICPCLKID